MKKSLLTIAAALAMVGCMKDEIVDGGTKPLDGNAVVFSTYVGRGALASKATVFDIDVLKGGDKPEEAGFGVFAYYTGQEDFNPETTYLGNQIFMNNTHVTWDEANGLWTYSPKKYWPNNYGDKVSFFAYAPYDKDAAAATAGLQDFVVANEVKDQVDIMWSNTNNVDKVKQAVNQYVNFNFAHALSRISFSVQAAVDDLAVEDDNEALDENTKIYVKRVAIINNVEKESKVEIDMDSDPQVAGPFYQEGDLDMLPYLRDPDYDLSVAAWDDKEGAQGFVLTADEHFADVIDYASTASGTAKAFLIYDGTGETNAHVSNGSVEDNRLNNDESYLMVIPQDLSDETDGGYRVYVEYDVVTSDPNGKDSHTVENNVISTKTIYTNFESGKAYNLNIVLGMTSVKVDATETEWESEDTNSENRDNYYSFEGEGTEDDPFLIPDAISLDKMAYLIEKDPELYANAYYKQTDDIDLMELDTKAERLNWVPMNGFLGHYDGGNHEILNLYFNTDEWVSEEGEDVPSLSLFGGIGSEEDEDGASVSNLIVHGDVYASGELYNYIATIATSAYNARFENIVSFVNFALDDYQGRGVSGIVGTSENVELVNCMNNGSIIMNATDYAHTDITGVAGSFTNSKMVACVNTGILVNKDGWTGGLAGITNGSQIVACYNTGDLSGSDISGIAVMIDGLSSITACYNTGSISSDDDDALIGTITGQITIREPQQAYILRDVYYYDENDVPVFTRFNYNNDMPEDDGESSRFVDVTFVDGEEVSWGVAADNMNNAICDVYDATDDNYWDFEWHFVETESDEEPLMLAKGLNRGKDEGDDDEDDDELYASLDEEPAFDNSDGILHLKTSDDMHMFAQKIHQNVAYMPSPEGEPVLYSEAAYEVDNNITIEGNWIPVAGFHGELVGNDNTITFNSNYSQMSDEEKEFVVANGGMGLFASLTGRQLREDEMMEEDGFREEGIEAYKSVEILHLNLAGTINAPKIAAGSVAGTVNHDVGVHFVSSSMELYCDPSEGDMIAQGGGIIGLVSDSEREFQTKPYLHQLQFHGKVVDFQEAGGIVAKYAIKDQYHCLDYSWNTGEIVTDMSKYSDKDVSLGGVVGSSYGNIVACYNTGKVELSNNDVGNAVIGGIAGYTSGIVQGVYNSHGMQSIGNSDVFIGELVGYLAVADEEEDINDRVNFAIYWGNNNKPVGRRTGMNSDHAVGSFININQGEHFYQGSIDTLNMGIKYGSPNFHDSMGMYVRNSSYSSGAEEGPFSFRFSGENDWDAINYVSVMLGEPDEDGYYLVGGNYELRYLSWGVNSGIREWTHGKFKLEFQDFSMGESITNFYPIGTEVSPFCGELIGNGRSISDLYLNASNVEEGRYGLFGLLSPDAVVDGVVLKNLHINVSATQKDDLVYVGGIAAHSRGTVKNCRVENGDIVATNTQQVAAVVGFADEGTISGNVVSKTKIEGNNVYHLGGVVGTAHQGQIFNNVFDGNADGIKDTSLDSYLVVGEGTVYAGGIVGQAFGTYPIYNESFIAANISQGTIDNSSNTSCLIGGIAGYIATNKNEDNQPITSDFFAGNISSCFIDTPNNTDARLLINYFYIDTTEDDEEKEFLDIKNNYAVARGGIELQPSVNTGHVFETTELASVDANDNIPMNDINNLWLTTYTGYGIKDVNYSTADGKFIIAE